MPRFAANLSMMFNEIPFLDRFAAARDAGFDAVEFLFPYDHPADEVGKRLHGNGLTQALFNLPPGNWDAGEKDSRHCRIVSRICRRVFAPRCLMRMRPALSDCT